MAFSTRIIVAGLAGLALTACEASQNVNLEGRDIMVQQTAVPANAASSSFEQISGLVRNSGPSYVTLVVSEKERPGTSSAKDGNQAIPVTSGSGFVVEGGGYIMTAAHVAKHNGNTISARAANGRVYSGKVVAIQPENDMALIKVRGFSGKAVAPADNQCLARGQMVYSLGRPHAQGDTARLGQFESMHFGQAVRYPGTNGQFGYPDAMVLRLGTQKGESGGPLFNAKGQLVGMVVSTLFDGNGQPLNLAHAVPSRTLASFLCSNLQCGGAWQMLPAQGNCANG